MALFYNTKLDIYKIIEKDGKRVESLIFKNIKAQEFQSNVQLFLGNSSPRIVEETTYKTTGFLVDWKYRKGLREGQIVKQYSDFGTVLIYNIGTLQSRGKNRFIQNCIEIKCDLIG